MTFAAATLLPLAVIALAAVFVPLGIARLLPRRLPMMLVNIGLSAVLLFVLGAVTLAAMWFVSAPGIGAELAGNPAGALVWLARQGLFPIVAWLPVLALVELVIAQKIAGEHDPEAQT